MSLDKSVGEGQVMSSERRPFGSKVKDKMPLLLVIWLFLTVLAPHQDIYKVFFHAIIIPSLLILLFSKKSGVDWKDPFLRISLVFFAYAAVSTFIVGSGPIDEHWRAFRWSIEVTFGLLALYVWMPDVVALPKRWGKLFLWLALVGSWSSIIIFVFFMGLQGRLEGLGTLHNPIQAASILLIYFALGQFMLNRCTHVLSRGEKFLIFASLVGVCLAVLLSESRAPIAALIVYLVFLGGLRLLNRPRIVEILLAAFLVCALVGAVLVLYGEKAYFDQLFNRGMSYRLEIWSGYLDYPPSSWWFGFGAGTPPSALPAAEAFWIPNNIPVAHAHNLFVGTLAETGIIGLVFLMAMIGLLVAGVLRQASSAQEKVRLLGVLGLVLLLSMTSSHTVISSIKAVWLILWVPVIFVHFWPTGNRQGNHERP